ncbi:UNVERIFIED_CONTAM: Retrovirus-related Pol polyprotein from transposon [Sesamum indicum]
MEGSSRRNAAEEETPRRGAGATIQITQDELQRMIDEASRKAIVEYERRTATPLVKETARRQLFENVEPIRESRVQGEHDHRSKRPASSDAGSSSHGRAKRREPVISRAEVESVGKQIHSLNKQIDELKKRGEIVAQNKNSPFCNEILVQTVEPGFRVPDLRRYDGMRDPQEHVAAFEMVMNLYGQSAPIMAKLFATTLTGKAQEWFTNLPRGSIESYEQLVQKFNFHFASKKKQKRSATHLFNIRQREDETLKNFMGRFNNETLEVQELRIDMLVSILIHGLRKGSFASALARDPPYDVEQLMAIAQKYIDEEEMNAMKDSERREREYIPRRPHEGRGGGNDKPKTEKRKEPKYVPKYHNYTPLAMSREKALMMVENADVLKWPRHTRYTPTKKMSNKYCRFHRERGHSTEECYQLKDEIERLVRQGHFRDRVPPNCKIGGGGRRSRSRSPDRDRNPGPSRIDRPPVGGNNAPTKGVIYTIAGGSTAGDSGRTRKRCARTAGSVRQKEFVLKVEGEEAISFNSSDRLEDGGEQNDPMVIKLDIANFTVHKVLIDSGSSADIIFKNVVDRMGLENARLEPVKTPLVGFGGSEVASLGTIELPVSMGEEPKRKTLMVKFLVVDTPFTYNVILGRPGLNSFRAVISTYHMKMKFPTEYGIGEVWCDQKEARKCYNLSIKAEPRSKKQKVREDAEPRPYEAEHLKPSEEYKAIQLATDDPSKTTRIGSSMKEGEMAMIDFLRNNADMFAWSPSDFTGIDPEVIVHRLNVNPTVRPVQQRKRTLNSDKNDAIRQEVDKLLKAGYISEIQYTNWLSNVVLVPKASGKWRMCVDFTDLNKACPKDPYPLPRIDTMVDSTAGFELFSMMDAYQGYHQIQLAEEDRDKTSFVTDKGIYCYNMMPFGLKNAGATYQRLVKKMFGDLLGKTMEVYVDDMLVKSKRSQDHIKDLSQAFSIMRSHGMKLNPDKCTFGVTGGKFLGYMISERGIEANPEKIQAIMNLRSPNSVKEVQKLTGKIASLSRFISRSAGKSLPFFKVLRKPKNFAWTSECDQALQELKKYLTKPPLLANPKEGETLFLYLGVSENAVSSVLVREEASNQNPVYYVSKMLQGAESRYSEMEKLALALIVTARKLRPYFQAHKVVVLTNHPLKHVMSRPEASRRLIKWAVELGQHDIEYQPRTAQKAQVLADFVTELMSDLERPEACERPCSKWMLHVDGSSNANNGGAGILIQGPEGIEIEVAARLSFPVTNNEAEYEALVLGLELAYEAGARDLEVFTDSQLIAIQIEGAYETRERTMTQYKEIAQRLMRKFSGCSLSQVPRAENDKADALSKFGAAMDGIRDRKITAVVRDRSVLTSGTEIQVVSEAESWMSEIIRYLGEGILPNDPQAAKRVKFRATRFTLLDGQLYKRTTDGPLLKCLDGERALYVMREIHEGSCGNHSGARSLAQKVMRQGYFWPTLVEDSKNLVRKCESCQKYASLIHQPATPLEPIKIACPFDQWGIDIVGPFPPAQAQKKFIIVAVEYFSKWVEAEAVAKISEREVINFIWKNIICRFGIPRILISDNGTQFQDRKITEWCKELKIAQHFTAVANPQANGQTEVTNRTILQHLKTRLESKGSWVDELPGVLWAYRTTPRTATGETPFCLVYGTEAIIPAEIGEESQRVMQYEPQTNQAKRSFDLTVIEEKREAAYARILHHKGLMMKSHDRKIRPRQLQVGDLVLKKVEASKHVGKLEPPWEGPYKVTEIRKKGTYRLQYMQGRDLPRPWNIQNLKKFYA